MDYLGDACVTISVSLGPEGAGFMFTTGDPDPYKAIAAAAEGLTDLLRIWNCDQERAA